VNFHSPAYAVFLVAVFAAHWALVRSRGARFLLLLASSYFFYGAWNWKYLGLLFFSTALDYYLAQAIATFPQGDPRRKRLVIVSVVANLSLLGAFKYYNFFRDTAVLWFGWDAPVFDVLLPAGISFYTFQSLSYTIDVYRGTIQPARNLTEFALFVAFFPQLVAGPIVRASEFLPQLDQPPRLTRRDIHAGLWRIMVGLTKKVLISDLIAVSFIDGAYAQGSEVQGALLLLALYGYCLQIYGDFSGYSDIAIGSAKLFGFTLPENFNAPYRARSMEEFWRRWHISLSTWLRDYLYYSLGGNRRGELRTYWNLWLTMALAGLWHGAKWNIVVWGMIHGTYLVVNRLWSRQGFTLFRSPLGQVVAGVLTFHFFAASMVVFRTTSFTHTGDVFARLFAPTQGAAPAWPVWAAFCAGVATHALPDRVQAALKAAFCALPSWVIGAIVPAFLGLLAASGPAGKPFMYFQF
jgi:D-alanyl-lipoteichoic acid acyltransferase DltB (MBOAT superfamily)